MRLFPIEDPVAGEQILAVQPTIETYPGADWRQRLEYFTGRALTHTALCLEQRGREGHLAMLGRSVSPGVVVGLEAVARQEVERVVIEIAAGMGIAESGEIVNINRNRRVLLDDIRVYAPASILGTEEGEAEVETSAEGAYRLGDILGRLRADGRALPEAMVLVLQPVAVEHFGQEPSTDPCDNDPTDEAFENWQWLDACRLVLYAWNQELGPLPVSGEWRRNRIAQAIFDYERHLNEGHRLPWSALGVPIALIGLNSTLEFDFLDRNAVARRGGKPKGTDVPITPYGNRLLWQARFEQFNEHLVDWLESDATLDLSQLRAEDQFRYLPPVAVLPTEVLSPREQRQGFFPVSYAVRASAIPHEQLDLAIEESAGLLPYDLNTPDRVEVLVPVPQQHYEPELLVVEQIDPAFELTIERFSAIRDQWLGRRLDLRLKASALYRSIKGRPLLYPRDDPNAVDSLEQPTAFEQSLVASGDPCRYRKGQSAPPRNWYQSDFDDSAWERGLTPIGYGADDRGTALDDMRNNYVTLYLRHRFNLDAIGEARRYTLRVTTNGGFYAYLNNGYLTSANVSRPFHDAPAAQAQELEPRSYELGELKGRLREGENVLAILAHNVSLNAEQFRVSVNLVDTEESYGTTAKRFDSANQPLSAPEYEVDELTRLRAYLDASTSLSDIEVSKLDAVGIEEYVDYLQAKIDRADDRVEFGFLRVRTDIYRVRQMMLGNEVATKLATSPALAAIAKGDSAVATKAELANFYERLKQGKEVKSNPGNIGDAPPPTSAPREASGPGSGADLFVSAELGDAGSETILSRAAKTGGKSISESSASDTSSDKQIVKKKSSGTELFKTATVEAVEGQIAIIGKPQLFNNVIVGERLEESGANASLLAGIAVKGDVLNALLAPKVEEDGINLEGLAIPGFRHATDEIDEQGEIVWKDVTKTFADIKDEGLVAQVLNGDHDPVGDDDDEAAYFNAGVKALENVVATLRLIEGRVHAYRRAVSRCKSAIAEIQTDLNRADQRLKIIGDELAEARHDVSVVQALKAEEQARIDALNEHRDKVLATQVPFLLFRRPRTLDPRLDLPTHYLDPDLSEMPLPLCDLSEVEVPEALEAMLDVVRDAPLKWFNAMKLILPQLNRPADLQVTLSGAKKRAASKVTVHPYLKQGFQTPDKLLQDIGATLVQSNQRIQVQRKQTARMDVSAFQYLGWAESMQPVSGVISLGDLIDANHGRLKATERAAGELAQIAQVASCLYMGFSGVSAGIRLHWAERLSQYDEAVNLRSLYSLPRFGELNYIERHNMQRLVDWLYDRVVSKFDDAENLISDLIRITLLVASHAPVNQLIAGHLSEPVTAQVGTRIQVNTDLTRVRVGMAFSMMSAGTTLVQGRIIDISGGQASAQVHIIEDISEKKKTAEVSTKGGKSVELDADTKVQIGGRQGAKQGFSK